MLTCLAADKELFTDNKMAIKGTAITAVFVPVKFIKGPTPPKFQADKLLGRLIVYWVFDLNKKTILYRSHSDFGIKSGLDITFSKPRPAAEDNIEVQTAAQIGFVLDPDEQLNRLYVSKVGEDNISQVEDKWFDDEKDGKSD